MHKDELKGKVRTGQGKAQAAWDSQHKAEATPPPKAGRNKRKGPTPPSKPKPSV